MKKLLVLMLVGAMAFSAVACGSTTEEAAPTEENTEEVAEEETVTVTVTDAEGKPVDVEFPVDPQRVVAMNWQTVDFLDSIGKGDQIVGIISNAGATPEHLEKYFEEGSDVVQVGSMKEPDMEAIMSLQPDVIFSSDRTEDMYEEFSAIAPTMSAYVDYSMGFMEGYKSLAGKHSQIFGVDGEVDEIIAGYDERITAIAEFAEGKTALLGIFAGGLNTLGNEGRASIVVNEMGFENLAGEEDVNHGNVSSYDAWLEMNPDWMFVLDKDTAVGEEATAAKEQMEVNNEVIAATDAYKNGQIVYLEPGTTWYVADGGITSLDQMITCIEEGIGLK